MSDHTKIEWADKTISLGHGCTKVSEGCHFCYAADWDKRRLYDTKLHWGADAPRLLLSEAYWKKPFMWNRQAERKGIRFKVFYSSMGDVFEDHPVVATERLKLWKIIEATPHLIWQLLTNRPSS